MPPLRRTLSRDRGPAFRVRLIVLLYMAVAISWILVADRIGMGAETFAGEKWSVSKSLMFVGFTGAMLYILIFRLASRLNHISESLRASETKYRLLIENSPDAILIERDGVIAFVNPAALELFGAAHDAQLLGRAFSDFFLPDPAHDPETGDELHGPHTRRKIKRIDGVERDVETSSVAYSDAEGPCVKHIVRDISETIQKNREIRRLNRIYGVLSQVNQTVVRCSSSEKLFAHVCDIITQQGGFSCAWVGWFDSGKNEVAPVAWSGEGADRRLRFEVASQDKPGVNIVARAVVRGRTCIANDFPAELCGLPQQSTAEAHGWRSAICLPIRRHRVICGVLGVCAGEPNFFQRAEVKLLEEVAMDVSFALDRLAEETLRRKTQEELTKSEEHLRFLVNHLHAGVMVFSPENKVTLLNSEIMRLVDSSRDKILARTPAEFGFHLLNESGEPLPANEFPSTRVLATGQPIESSIVGIERPGGEGLLWLHANAFPERDGSGALRQVIVTFVDISAHKQAMEALSESEEKFRTLFSASRDAILLMEGKNYFDCNQAALEMFRCPDKKEFLKRKLGELSAIRQPGGNYSAQIAPQLVEKAVFSSMAAFQWMCKRFDGTEFIAELALAPVAFRGRTVVQAVVRDISWRRQAEQQLWQLSRVVEQCPVSVVITDIFGNIQYVNPRFSEDTGYTKEEIIGENPRILQSGQTPPALYDNMWKAIASGQEWRGEFCDRKKNGELFWQSASISPIFNKSGAITQFLAIEQDITEQKRTEAALVESEGKFVKAFNTAPVIMLIFTFEDVRCVEVNNAFVEASGYTRAEALGHTLPELGIMEQRVLDEFGEKLMQQKELRNEECVATKKNGETLTGLLSADLIEIGGTECVIATMLDITERKQMEEQFLRVQRMESIGALAGGMAHDLNNILSPILMSASMLREDKVSAASRKQLVVGIEEAAQRGANIVNQVLTFARGVKGRHTVINTAELAREISKMVREIFPKSIVFDWHVNKASWNIRGDSTQLQQVFLNLCVNSRDAMLDGGMLTFDVDNIEIDEAFARMVPSAVPGRYVQFSVKDTGTGIPRKLLDRIFEPFFTTKEQGKGTGLGLSTAVGIVRSHGGFMKVDSEPGKGSTFRVFIPATNSAAGKPQKPEHPPISRGRGEVLLVVDDEPEILEIICSILQQNGWNTLPASDGVEGVASFLMHSGEIRGVLTDMVMPNMDGLGLIRSVRKLAPELPILVASGFSTEESRGELEELGVNLFLRKPFSARQLVTSVVSLLYGKNAAPEKNGK